MKPLLYAALIVFSSALGSAPSWAQYFSPSGLHASGRGKAQVRADIVRVQLGVSAQAATAAAALDSTSAAMVRVIAYLKSAGVSEADIRTNAISLHVLRDGQPSRETPQPPILGHSASNTVVVRVRDLQLASRIVRESVANGANSLSSIGFESSRESAAQDEALKLAVADARRKAAIAAAAAEVTLGPMTRLDTSRGAGENMGNNAADAPVHADPDVVVPIEPGLLEFTWDVEASWSIAPR